MSIMMKLGRVANAFLTEFGFKITIYNRRSKQTFAENQLLKALAELNALYDTFVFEKEHTTDEEPLKILSNSMYTKFGTGFYLIDCLRQTLNLEGDICEFGVAQGAISALLAYEIKNTHKDIWLFDSFEGLPGPTERDILIRDPLNAGSIDAYEGWLSFPEGMVRTRLAAIGFPPERTRIVSGFIERTLHGPNLPKTVCFAYVDLNLYEPILFALNFLDTVLLPGGFVVVDDYENFSQGVKSAVDEFYTARRDFYSIKFPIKTAGKFCILSKK
jgi:O-methyltransferase